MQYTYRDDIHRRLHEGLLQEAELRDKRPHSGPNGWVELEECWMLYEVNRLRELRGKSRVPRQRVTDANNMATGHCDYATKFALYCAELVDEE